MRSSPRLADFVRAGLDLRSHEETLPDGTGLLVWRYWGWSPWLWAWRIDRPGMTHSGTCRLRWRALRTARREARYWARAADRLRDGR